MTRLCCALLLAMGGSACGQTTTKAEAAPASSPGPTTQLVVIRGDLVPRMLLTGELDAVDSADIVVPRTPTWAVAIRWLEKDGTLVKKGQKVVELDNSAFTTQLEDSKLQFEQALIDLETEIAVKELNISDKLFKAESAQVAVEKARLDANVPAESLPRRVHQERQLALKRAQVALAKANDEAQAAKQMAGLDVKIKRVELDKTKRQIKTSEDSIEALVLRAPRDGMMVLGTHPWEGRKLQVGENVHPGWVAAKIPDLTVMEVRATMSDVDDGRITVGTKVRCTLDAYPDLPFAGVIQELTPIAREPTSGSLRRNFSVRIALQKTDHKRMRPGLSVRVDVPLPTVTNQLLAPRATLKLGGEQARVLLAGGGSRNVTLGECDAHHCVVLAGLSEGQRLRHRRGQE